MHLLLQRNIKRILKNSKKDVTQLQTVKCGVVLIATAILVMFHV